MGEQTIGILPVLVAQVALQVVLALILAGVLGAFHRLHRHLHKNFDHRTLAKILKKRNNWILSYNTSKEIHELYSDYTILYPDWKYGMSHDKSSREVLILSHDIAKKSN